MTAQTKDSTPPDAMAKTDEELLRFLKTCPRADNASALYSDRILRATADGLASIMGNHWRGHWSESEVRTRLANGTLMGVRLVHRDVQGNTAPTYDVVVLPEGADRTLERGKMLGRFQARDLVAEALGIDPAGQTLAEVVALIESKPETAADVIADLLMASGYTQDGRGAWSAPEEPEVGPALGFGPDGPIRPLGWQAKIESDLDGDIEDEALEGWDDEREGGHRKGDLFVWLLPVFDLDGIFESRPWAATNTTDADWRTATPLYGRHGSKEDAMRAAWGQWTGLIDPKPKAAKWMKAPGRGWTLKLDGAPVVQLQYISGEWNAKPVGKWRGRHSGFLGSWSGCMVEIRRWGRRQGVHAPPLAEVVTTGPLAVHKGADDLIDGLVAARKAGDPETVGEAIDRLPLREAVAEWAIDKARHMLIVDGECVVEITPAPGGLWVARAVGRWLGPVNAGPAPWHHCMGATLQWASARGVVARAPMAVPVIAWHRVAFGDWELRINAEPVASVMVGAHGATAACLGPWGKHEQPRRTKDAAVEQVKIWGLLEHNVVVPDCPPEPEAPLPEIEGWERVPGGVPTYKRTSDGVLMWQKTDAPINRSNGTVGLWLASSGAKGRLTLDRGTTAEVIADLADFAEPRRFVEQAEAALGISPEPPTAPDSTWKATEPPRVKCRWRDRHGGEGTATPDGDGWCLEVDSCPSDFEVFAALPDGWQWSPMPDGDSTEPAPEADGWHQGEPEGGSFALIQWGRYDAGLAVRRGGLWAVLWIEGGCMFPDGGHSEACPWRADWRWRRDTVPTEPLPDGAMPTATDWRAEASKAMEMLGEANKATLELMVKLGDVEARHYLWIEWAQAQGQDHLDSFAAPGVDLLGSVKAKMAHLQKALDVKLSERKLLLIHRGHWHTLARRIVGDFERPDNATVPLDAQLRALVESWLEDMLLDHGKALSEASAFRQWARARTGLPAEAFDGELRDALTARLCKPDTKGLPDFLELCARKGWWVKLTRVPTAGRPVFDVSVSPGPPSPEPSGWREHIQARASGGEE